MLYCEPTTIHAYEADTCRTYILPKLHAAGWCEHLPPEQLAANILKKEQRVAEIMAAIQAVLGRGNPT